MYNEFAIKFKYLSSIENQGLALLRLEQNKKAIATSQFGKTNIKDGEILQGSPTFGYNDFSKSYVHFKNLPKIIAEIEELKKKIL